MFACHHCDTHPALAVVRTQTFAVNVTQVFDLDTHQWSVEDSTGVGASTVAAAVTASGNTIYNFGGALPGSLVRIAVLCHITP